MPDSGTAATPDGADTDTDADAARRLHRRADGVGAVALALLFGAMAVLAPAGFATPAAWVFAVVATASGAAYLWHHPRGPATPWRWLWLAFQSTLLAALFYGANEALDLLRPPGRRNLPYATVFGLELWTLFCPLLTAVALAGGVRAAWLARAVRRPVSRA